MVEKQSDEAPWTIQQTFLGIFVTIVPLVLLNSLRGGNPSPTTRLSPQVDLVSAIVTFVLACVLEGALLIAPLYFANRAFRSIAAHTQLALQSLGFRSFRAGATFSWIVLLLIAILGTNLLYGYVIQVLHLPLQTNDQLVLKYARYAPLTTYAALIVAIFVAPICEEVFFRGFVFAGLLRVMPLGWAIVLSSLIFAVVHADIGSFAVLFIIGLALAFLRWRTNSLWPGILLHTLNNGIAALGIVLTMQR